MSTDDAPTKTISDYEAVLTKADSAVAAFRKDDRSFTHVIRGALRRNPTLIPALILVISVIAFGLIARNFLSAGTLSKIVEQGMLTAMIALAQTIVILTAGIDLSVGAILVISTLVMGNLAVNLGLPVGVAVLIGMITGGVLGAANGILVALLRLPPFIVTLGTMSIFNALKKWYSGSQSIRGFTGLQPAGHRRATDRTHLVGRHRRWLDLRRGSASGVCRTLQRRWSPEIANTRRIRCRSPCAREGRALGAARERWRRVRGDG